MTALAAKPSVPLTDAERLRLGELYEANHDAVFRQCSRILRDPEEAADACQDVFIAASRTFGEGPLPASPRGWLLTVARNHCLDVLRRRKRLGKVLTIMGHSQDDPVNPEAAVVGWQTIDSVLRGLSPRERQALWQSAVESRPVADIASALRINYMAAAQVLSRARRRAALAMAQVAAILFGLRILRRAGQSRALSPTAILNHSMQLAALAAVPIIIVTTSSSSNPTSAANAQASGPSVIAAKSPATTGGNSHYGTAGVAGHGSGSIQVLPSVPGGAGATIGSTVGQVAPAASSVARGLPPLPSPPIPAASPSVPPLPSPSLPPVPSANPSLPPIPSLSPSLPPVPSVNPTVPPIPSVNPTVPPIP